MKPSVENIRLSSVQREIMKRIKKQTRFENWNVISRLAFVISVRQDEAPPKQVAGQTAVEMTWRTFAGEFESVYEALLCREMERHSERFENAPDLLHAHLARGLPELERLVEIEGIAGVVAEFAPAFT